MRYTIITPTLLRPSLARLCESLNRQTCGDWQHIVAIDREPFEPPVDDPRRKVVFRDGPWIPRVWERVALLRHRAWEHAAGDYLLYIDDDNYLADDQVLESLLAVSEPVALFPLEYRGQLTSPLPVAAGRSDGNGLMVRREIGRWPLLNVRGDDGEFVVQLTADHRFEVVDGRALVVYEREGWGRA